MCIHIVLDVSRTSSDSHDPQLCAVAVGGFCPDSLLVTFRNGHILLMNSSFVFRRIVAFQTSSTCRVVQNVLVCLPCLLALIIWSEMNFVI